METAVKNDYLLRISQATPTQLVVINYEILTDYIREALAAYDTDQPAFTQAVDKAKNALVQLMLGLDLSITLAQDLFRIYTYINQRLNTAFFSRDRDAAEEALTLAETLLTGWRAAAGQDTETQPVIGGAPSVYAGLTYQKDGLSEYVNQDDDRGYQA